MPNVTISDEDLIKAIGEDRARNDEIDEACIRRLKHLASNCGKVGEFAEKLLDVVVDLLDY